MIRALICAMMIIYACAMPVKVYAGLYETSMKYAKEGKYPEAYQTQSELLTQKNKKIKKLKELVRFYRKRLKALENAEPPATNSYEETDNAKQLWQNAWDMQRTAIFKKVGREKEDLLEDAVAKYSEIIMQYPKSKEAEDAQFRIGRIYCKFLKDRRRGQVEYQKYLERFPQGEHAGEARDELKK